MLRAAALVLSAITVLDAKSLDTRRLDPPRNLSLGHENPTQVALYWNFTVPRGIDPEDVIFQALVRNVTNTMEGFKHVRHGGPFHFMLNSLEPGGNYHLELWAAHPRLENSPVTEICFTTMQKDWATPVITNVTSKESGDYLNYTLRWKLPHESGYLSHFEVLVCAPACRSFRADPHDFNATVLVPFYMSFTLRVVASYDVPAVGTIARQSPTFGGRSKMSAPAMVEHLTRVSQVGNKITIDWDQPRPANGPLNYHEVIIYDKLTPAFFTRVNITGGTRATILAPHILSNQYGISIRAVNVDSDGKTYEGEHAIFYFEGVEMPKTTEVRIFSRCPDWIGFEIYAANPQDNMLFFVDNWDSIKLVDEGENKRAAIDLEPFTTFLVEVTTCYPTSDNITHTCEEPSSFEFVSNVGCPSEVRNLVIRLTADNFIVGSWEAPLVPNGPAYTYDVEIMYTDTKMRGTRSYKFSTNRSYIDVPKKESWEDLQIGVAAVNFDLDDSSINYTSEIVYTKPKMDPQPERLVVSLLILGVLILFVVILSIWFCCRRRRDGAPGENDDPPPYEPPGLPPPYEHAVQLDGFEDEEADEGQGVAEQEF